MKVGIRFKLFILLASVALLPLLGGLVINVVGSVRMQRDSYRRAFGAVAVSASRALEQTLVSDVRQLSEALGNKEIISALSERTTKKPQDELDRIDRELWEGLTGEDPPLSDVLAGPDNGLLDILREGNSRLVEVFFTDRYGQLVTATNKTSDFYQADEDWWVNARRSGQGSVWIPRVDLDESSGAWSLDLCVPIFDETGTFLGVGKGVVKLSSWFEDLRQLAVGINGSVMVVDDEGRIVFRHGVQPLSATAPEWSGAVAEADQFGWRTTEDGEMQAYVPIVLDETKAEKRIVMPPLTLVVYGDEELALGNVYGLAALTVAVGLVGIVILFLAGLYLIDRSLVKRILRIATTARTVAGGDLSARVRKDPKRGKASGQASAWVDDEIESLGRDFDNMVEKVEQTHRQLASANDLKARFISIAGHELRTPVGYIAGMAKLHSSSEDATRLVGAMRSIEAKAERLRRIVETMFKLMPDGFLPRTLEYREVDPEALFRRLRAEVEPFLARRDQQLVTETDGVRTFRADREKLLDVLENLLTNAIKFTPDGGTVRMTARAEPGDQIALAVTDEGEGIPSEEISHLFEPFFSGGDVLQHSTGSGGFKKRGIGLGLAIVRYFVELHRGSVEATTSPSGSTFIVRIPARPPED